MGISREIVKTMPWRRRCEFRVIRRKDHRGPCRFFGPGVFCFFVSICTKNHKFYAVCFLLLQIVVQLEHVYALFERMQETVIWYIDSRNVHISENNWSPVPDGGGMHNGVSKVRISSSVWQCYQYQVQADVKFFTF